MHWFSEASAYIESLRSPSKKRYAKDYYQFLRAGEQGDAPPYEALKLSYMGAQAVRITLHEIKAKGESK